MNVSVSPASVVTFDAVTVVSWATDTASGAVDTHLGVDWVPEHVEFLEPEKGVGDAPLPSVGRGPATAIWTRRMMVTPSGAAHESNGERPTVLNLSL